MFFYGPNLLKLSLRFSGGESTGSFFFQGCFKRKTETLGLQGKVHKAKIKAMKSPQTNETGASAEVKGRQGEWKAQGGCEAEQGARAPSSRAWPWLWLSHTDGTWVRGVPGRGAHGRLGRQWSSQSGRRPRCTLVREGGGGFVSPSPLFPLVK